MSTPPDIRPVTVGRYGLTIPFALLLAACATGGSVGPEEPPGPPAKPQILMDCYDAARQRLAPCPAT